MLWTATDSDFNKTGYVDVCLLLLSPGGFNNKHTYELTGAGHIGQPSNCYEDGLN